MAFKNVNDRARYKAVGIKWVALFLGKMQNPITPSLKTLCAHNAQTNGCPG